MRSDVSIKGLAKAEVPLETKGSGLIDTGEDQRPMTRSRLARIRQ